MKKTPMKPLLPENTGRHPAPPNLQRTPLRTEEGRALQRAFAKLGPDLSGVDYAEIELRIAAEIIAETEAGDEDE